MIKAIWKFIGTPLSYRIVSVLACIYLAIAEVGRTGSVWSLLTFPVMFFAIWSLGVGSAERPASPR